MIERVLHRILHTNLCRLIEPTVIHPDASFQQRQMAMSVIL